MALESFSAGKPQYPQDRGTYQSQRWRTEGVVVGETSAAMERAQGCREHQILHGRLRADTKVYVDVTRRLESCKPEDFEKTYEAAQSAHLAFLKARKALAVHVHAHRCER